MTLEEVRAKRKAAEKEIEFILDELEKIYGIDILSIDIQSAPVNLLTESRHKVSIRIEL